MTLEEFQNAVAERKQAKGKRPRPYEDEQRKFAIDYARNELASGSRKSEILRRLGISDATLSKWMGLKTTKDKGFRQVTVKSDASSSDGIQVVTPGGYRIEGLTVESATALLRAMG